MGQWNEYQPLNEKALRDAKAAKQAAEDAECEREREELSRRRAERDAEDARRAARAARTEAEEQVSEALQEAEDVRVELLAVEQRNADLRRVLTRLVEAYHECKHGEWTRAMVDELDEAMNEARDVLDPKPTEDE